MSMLFSPVGLSPPAQVHRGGKSGAPCHLPLREPPFPGSEMLLLHPRAADGHPGPHSPIAGRQKWDRGELSGPLEAGAGGVEKKGSLEERAQGLWYLYKKDFQFWFPSGITCKALKNTPVSRFYPGTNKTEFLWARLWHQIILKNIQTVICRQSWEPSLYYQLLKG